MKAENKVDLIVELLEKIVKYSSRHFAEWQIKEIYLLLDEIKSD